MTNDKKRRKITYISVLSLVLVFVFIQLVQAAGSDPGSSEDPIISKSYLDTVVQNLQGQINALKSQPSSGSSSSGFEVISINAGQYLYTGNGTEIVVRSGFPTALTGTNGDLSDVTSAKDLSKGVIVPKNHLIISSRDDNRGIYATTQCYILVRGSYKVSGQSTTTTPTDNNQNGSTNTNNSGTSTTTSKTGTVTASTLNIRASASATATIVGKATIGDTVTILSTSSGWYKVKTSAGVTGWASSSYITIQ